MMRHIINVAFTSTRHNFDTVVEFRGRRVRISQYGANHDPAMMEALLRRFDGQCDVLAVTGLLHPVKVGRRLHPHPDSARYVAIPKKTPVVTGLRFRNNFVPWAVRTHTTANPDFFRRKRVSFLSGLFQQHLVQVLQEQTERLYFADPYVHFRLPHVLRGVEALDRYARRMLPLLRRIPLRTREGMFDLDPWLKTPRFQHFLDADIFVAPATLLERLDPSYLRGKTVLLDSLPHTLERELRRHGVRDVLFFTPEDERPGQRDERLTYPIIEALLQVTKEDESPVTEDDVLALIMEMKLKPRLRSLTTGVARGSRKFAFIIHPLSIDDFVRHPALKPLRPLIQPLKRPIERSLSLLPGMAYGRITGVRSAATGEMTEGLIYTLFDTPRQLLNASPEKVYEKLVAVAEHASAQGADIIGLGAFTKVVGDAGVTVAARSPIPVTTGNSLSAAATLWAARVALEKLGFSPPFKKGKRYSGTVMVVGASGSIGAVAAKLMARVVERVVLVAPRGDKLLETKAAVEAACPNCEVIVATNPDKHSGQCDLIILSTSSLDGEVLDMAKVKPGCVICDVSRPLSISPRQVMQRPDVLVIESGEVELPGDVQISCDIGLDESTVYACLAETALLALEGRLEAFTLSRTINLDRVNEIYDLAKKHGARLATIRGPLGIVTDQEIALCRAYAEEALKTWNAHPKDFRAKEEGESCHGSISLN